MDDSVVVSYEHVFVRSGSACLFEDLSFRVAVRESWAIVGASGSGKSALLETIAGSKAIVKGIIARPLLEAELSRRQQDYPDLTIAHLIAMVTTKHVFKSSDNTTGFYYQQRFNSFDAEEAPTALSQLLPMQSYASGYYWTFEKVVERLHLQHLLDKPVIMLSNGETKRLLIAKALIKNPVLLLMDAPYTGLDVMARKELADLITDIIDSGIQIVMATKVEEIPSAITHVAEMDNRKIIGLFERKKYTPSTKVSDIKLNIDDAILKQLLSLRAKQQFDFIVDMKNVVIRYGDKLILDHLNWRVKQGERWALKGQNGSGKSTLLSLINGDNPQAFANDIVLFDRKKGSGESIWDIKQKIGFVSPELFQYFPTGTSCHDVIESGFYDTIGLFRAPMEENSAIIKAWMNLLGISSIARQQLRQVSESQQRLCLLARALVKNPVLLILDEPCQGLDDQQRMLFRQLVDAVCRNSDTTLIYVSHYEEDIPSVVTKVMELGIKN